MDGLVKVEVHIPQPHHLHIQIMLPVETALVAVQQVLDLVGVLEVSGLVQLLVVYLDICLVTEPETMEVMDGHSLGAGPQGGVQGLGGKVVEVAPTVVIMAVALRELVEHQALEVLVGGRFWVTSKK